ncbi:MAG: hypothetical protein PHU23_15055 [Dehalococcoidales bacterium]|nr:hypothetical protein [Dehalococcoidales bacterium]
MKKSYFIIIAIFVTFCLSLEMLSCSFGGANVPQAQGPDVPPNIDTVQPPQDVSILERAIISVHFDLLAGQGMSPDPEVSDVSLFLDGERIVDTVWTVEGQPPSEGSIKADTEPGKVYPLNPGKRTFEVRYKDLADKQWSFSWDVTVQEMPTSTIK